MKNQKRSFIIIISIIAVIALSSIVAFIIVSVDLIQSNQEAIDYYEELGFEVKGDDINIEGVWVDSNIFRKLEKNESYDNVELSFTKAYFLNPDFFPEPYIEYWNISDSSMVLNGDNINSVKCCANELNNIILKTKIEGIRCAVYFKTPITDEEASYYIAQYSIENYPHELFHGDPDYGCSVIGLYVKDTTSLSKLIKEDNVSFIDSSMDAYFLGRHQKSAEKRNGNGYLFSNFDFAFTNIKHEEIS